MLVPDSCNPVESLPLLTVAGIFACPHFMTVSHFLLHGWLSIQIDLSIYQWPIRMSVFVEMEMQCMGFFRMLYMVGSKNLLSNGMLFY